MGVVPNKKQERINWYAQRMNLWATNETELGFQHQDIVDLSQLVTDAALNFTIAEQARETSKSATLTLDNTLAQLSVKGAGMIEQVRAKAKVEDNPDLFV